MDIIASLCSYKQLALRAIGVPVTEFTLHKAVSCSPPEHTPHPVHPSLCLREPRVGAACPGWHQALFMAQTAQCATLPAVPLRWLCVPPMPCTHTHLVSLLWPHQRDSVVLAPQQRPERVQPALREHSGLSQGAAAHPAHTGLPGATPGTWSATTELRFPGAR